MLLCLVCRQEDAVVFITNHLLCRNHAVTTNIYVEPKSVTSNHERITYENAIVSFNMGKTFVYLEFDQSKKYLIKFI